MYRSPHNTRMHAQAKAEVQLQPIHNLENKERRVTITTSRSFTPGKDPVLNVQESSKKKNCVRLRLNCDSKRAGARFRLSAKRTSPFKSVGGGGGQFSRLPAPEVCASAVLMLDTPCSEVV